MGQVGIIGDSELIETTKKNLDFTRALAAWVESCYKIFIVGWSVETSGVKSASWMFCLTQPKEHKKSDKKD